MADPKRPDVSTEQGRLSFIQLLNKRLPKKRNIAQGVLRNERGEILLCQLTYKREWDLPGGVVDPSESPADCVVREISEELGLEVSVERLIAVNWLPPWRGWDDAVLFLFDLGVIAEDAIDPGKFLRREIKGIHWRSIADAGARIAGYTARMLEVVDGLEHTAYLENSELTGGAR
jgi:8-oxo-dGTP diphosphatase